VNDGWKAFTIDCGIWEGLSEKDAASKNSLIFMACDKIDLPTAAALIEQAGWVGPLRGAGRVLPPAPLTAQPGFDPSEIAREIEEGIVAATSAAIDAGLEAENDFKTKPTRQLSRPEFLLALVKTAIERFVRGKQRPKNEMDDVGDALERLLSEHVAPALGRPRAGRSQPMLPLADEFRTSVCYTQQTTHVLSRLAPSLRVLFAGLAKISFEFSRTVPPQLPKGGKNKLVERPGRAKWMIVPGHVSFAEWRRFLDVLKLVGLEIREITQCFLYAIMGVVNGQSADGRVKERYLPFEGFLEALVRLATAVPLPTDVQMASAEFTHAGAYLDHLLEVPSDNVGVLDQMLAEQACEWCGVPEPSVAGTMPRRVEHLLDVIVRKIKQPKEIDEPLGVLTRREFRMWAIRTMGVAESQIPDTWAKEAQPGEA